MNLKTRGIIKMEENNERQTTLSEFDDKGNQHI